MATITQKVNIYFRPSSAAIGSAFPYDIVHDGINMDGYENDWIIVDETTIQFENNIDTRAAQIDLIDKAIAKLDADHYAKKTQLETRRNELLAIGCDSTEQN